MATIEVTGVYHPLPVDVTVLQGAQRIAVMHVAPRTSMISAHMQHSKLLDTVDIVLRTFGDDVAPGRYQVVDMGTGDAMARLLSLPGIVHDTSEDAEFGHVILSTETITAAGVASRMTGEPWDNRA